MKIGDLQINNISTKINKKNIFIGNIKRCTKYREVDMANTSYVRYNSQIYAKDVILVKVSDNPVGYINLRSFESLLDYLKDNDIRSYEAENLEDAVLYTQVSGEGSIWVDNASLKPYYKNEKGKVKAKKINRKIVDKK